MNFLLVREICFFAAAAEDICPLRALLLFGGGEEEG
jgi:hypothetical protein